jgi:deazaflavin-dependent oxidoreductase (nitroreductase family)
VARGPFRPPKLAWKVWNVFTRSHVLAYRLTGGRVGRTFRGGPVLLLDHVGRKSGERRTHPLLYLADGEDLVIVASKGGSHKHPAWWLNLRERPNTTVQVGSEKRPVTAQLAHGEERARLWPRLVELYAPYADYQTRTSREIPVVVLRRSA